MYHRCFYTFKCKQGYISHHLSLIEKKDIPEYSTRNKCNVRFPSVKTNWDKQSLEYHAVKDWDDLNDDINHSNGIFSFGNNFFRYT